MRRARPSRLAVAAAVVALAAAGCTSDTAPGADYARDLDRFCQRLSAAAADVEEDAVRARRGTERPSDAVRAVGPVLERFAERTAISVDDLRDAEPPAEYARFHAEAVGAVDAYVARVRRGATLAERGDPAALRRAGRAVSRVQTPRMPPALDRMAPSCRRLSG